MIRNYNLQKKSKKKNHFMMLDDRVLTACLPCQG